MLVAGKAEKGNEEVDNFVEVCIKARDNKNVLCPLSV